MLLVAIAANHNAQALLQLAHRLLAAGTLNELLETVPGVLSGAIDPALESRISLAGDEATGPTDAEFLCIPLDGTRERRGAIVLSRAAEELPPDLTLAPLEEIRQLVGAAIAARIKAETEQQQLVKEAAELRLDLISILSHEMRTPLASIKGFASALLLDEVEWDTGTRTEFLQTIETESDHLTKLIEDILESAALEAGAIRIDLEAVTIPAVVQRVIDKLSIHTGPHRFVVVFPNRFPVVDADTQRIEQVLTNLLDNAVKYSPDGGVIVVRGEVVGDEVLVSVVDQGIGIAPEHLNKLFERFFRASSDRRRDAGGTGLGLPIAEAIVRAHGGRIWAESTLGSGTTLAFTLPLPAGSGNR